MPPAPLPEPVILPADARRLARALEFAAERHGGQARAGTAIPYVSDLLQVAGLVLAHGGGVDQAMAALLHGVIGDGGVTAAELDSWFGARIARLVQGCTHPLAGETPAPDQLPWPERQRRYLAHLASAPPASRLVAACVQRHALATLVAELRRDGPGRIHRASAAPQARLWFYRAVRDTVRGHVPAALGAELAALTDELAALLGLA